MKIFRLILVLFLALNFTYAKEQNMDIASLPQAKFQTGALSKAQLSIVRIASLTAANEPEKLKAALTQGLEDGLSVNEIKEILAHQHAYIGFPLSLNGIIEFNKILKERTDRRVKENIGKQASKLPENTDYYAFGQAVQKYIFKRDFSGQILFDNEAADRGLKAHLFGYLFSRDNLSFVNREITTVSSIAVLDNVDMQLTSHLNGITNLGVNEAGMEQIFAVLAENFKDKAEHARKLYKNIKK